MVSATRSITIPVLFAILILASLSAPGLARQTAWLTVVWDKTDVTNPDYTWLSIEEFDEQRNRWMPARGIHNPVMSTHLNDGQGTFSGVPTNTRIRIKGYSSVPGTRYSPEFKIQRNSRFDLWNGRRPPRKTEGSFQNFLRWLFG